MNQRTLFLLLSLFVGWASVNQKTSATPTVYSQLCELNKYWVQHPIADVALQQSYEFADHEALIRYHLMNVEYVLRHNAASNLSAEQKNNRTKALNILHDYWMAGVFPKNTHHSITIPYFIDDFNTACAVGHLIRETGYETVACKIADEMNYAYIEQMPYKELPIWANKMGFTVDELKWIQPAYSPPIRIENSITKADCNSTNGAIDATIVENGTGVPISIYPQKWYSLKGSTVGFVGQTEDLTNKPAGLYKVDVLIGDGMFPVVYNLIGLDNDSDIAINATVQNETCLGSADGQINIAINGGTPPYDVRWYNQGGQVVGSGAVLSNLSAGNTGIIMYEVNVPQYIVEVTDAEGCKKFGQFDISYDHYSDYGYVSTTEAACGTNNGVITINYPPENGSIVWLHDANLTSNIANNLAAGVYTVAVTNEWGCEYVQQVIVNSVGMSGFLWDKLTVSPDYCGQKVGSISITHQEGNTYNWSHDVNLHLNHADSLVAGNYTVTVTLPNGCKAVQYVAINNHNNINTSSIELTNANSLAGTLGSASLAIYEEVGHSYSYAWQHNAGLNSATATGLQPGIYSLTITDETTGCSLEQTFEVYDEVQLSSGIGSSNLDLQPIVTTTNETLYLDYSYTGASALQLNVFDVMGRQVASKSLGVGSGFNRVSLPIESLPSGVYLLSLSSSKGQQVVKWVK